MSGPGDAIIRPVDLFTLNMPLPAVEFDLTNVGPAPGAPASPAAKAVLPPWAFAALGLVGLALLLTPGRR